MLSSDVEVREEAIKVVEVFKEEHRLKVTPLELAINIRLSGLSLPCILALAIVDSNAHARYPMVYVGEVEAFFMSYYRPGKGQSRWTYSAIGRMLRELHKKGYLTRERHGRYVAYGMEKVGIKLIKQLGISLKGGRL